MKQRKIIALGLALLIILTGFFFYRTRIKSFWLDLTKEPLPQEVPFANNNQPADDQQAPIIDGQAPTSSNSTGSIVPAEEKPELADSINLKAPFTSQAPFNDWSMPFKEACEEASLLMVNYFYRGKTFTRQIAKDEILKMVGWLDENFAGKVDLTAAETAAVAKDYLGYKRVDVIDNPTVEQIKAHLNQQHPVIVPAAGQMLGNPNFRSPGPVYHMLVIKGYTATKFITNDPGTRNGADYVYSYQTLMNAMHDWNNGAEIRQGAKRVIVIYPN